MGETTLQLFIQAGAVGIALALIALIFRMIKYFQGRDAQDRLALINHLSKQLEQETLSRDKLTAALTKLDDSINHLQNGCARTSKEFYETQVKFSNEVDQLENIFKEKYE